MQPRVTKRERKLHLSYELPHRVHAADIYPITAPNGSTVLLYGHSNGLRVLWRGGRRQRGPAAISATPANGTRQDQPISLDDSTADTQDEYEAEEDETDPDCPYPNILQELDIETGSGVLHIAVPHLQASSLTPAALRDNALVAIAGTDNAVRLLQIPLALPSDEQKQDILDGIAQSQIELSSGGHLTSGLAVKFVPIEHQPHIVARNVQENITGHILVAACSRSLKIWSTPITVDTIMNEDNTLLHHVPLQSSRSRLAFHPSFRSAQLLLADHNGAARVYDPHATSVPSIRPTSSDSAAPPHTTETGRWITTFHTSYHTQQVPDPSAVLSRRKKIIDAKWVLAGKAILTLLEDGHWGVWETNGPTKPDKPVESFAIEGYLGSSNTGEPVESTKPRKGASKLAPMTPNTRRTKAQELFKGATKVPGAANYGGISVASISPRAGQTDESVVMWFNSDIYSITSMQSFWQRSTSSTGGFGSLYSPGLAHITDVDLINEHISSISQFPSKNFSSTGSQMNTQRDLLVAAEHRAVILQSLRQTGTSRTLFQLAERPASRGDVQMIDAGDTELDRINTALDKMTAIPSKSVGFAT